MMKNRFFMLGLGVGLIAGALLLQLMIAGRAAPLTKEELIQQATRLNLTLVDPAEASATATPSPEEGASAPASQAAAKASCNSSFYACNPAQAGCHAKRCSDSGQALSSCAAAEHRRACYQGSGYTWCACGCCERGDLSKDSYWYYPCPDGRSACGGRGDRG
ncbi:hypothetical protein ACFTAO_26680 [Paenibacillus rhizoplanae]